MAEDGKVVIKFLADDGPLQKGLGKVASVVKEGIGATAKTLAGFATAAGAGIVAIGKFANDTAQAADRVDKTSQRIGLSYNAFQEWDYILGQCGGSVDNLEIGMKTMVSVLDGVSQGQSTYIDILNRLQTESGKQIDLNATQEEQFEQIVDALMSVSDETTRAALASDMFGRAGVDMIPMLNSGKATVDSLRQAAHDLGFVMSDETVLAGVAMGDAIDDLKKACTGFLNSAMAPLLPEITNLAKGLTGVIIGAEGADEQLKGALLSTVDTLCDSIDNLLPMVLDVGVDLLLSLADGIIQAIPQLTERLPEVITRLVEGVIELAPGLISAGWELIKAMAQGVAEAGLLLLKAFITNVWDPVNEKLLEKVDSLKSFGKDMLAKLCDGVKSAATSLMDSFINNVWEPVHKWFPEMIESVKDIGKNIIEGLVNGIKDLASKPVDAIKNVGSKVLTGIKDFFGIKSPSKVMMTIGEFIDKGLAGGIMNSQGEVLTAAEAQAAGIKNVFVVLGEDGTELGAGVSMAIADGIAEKGKEAEAASLNITKKIKTQWNGMKLGSNLDIAAVVTKFKEGQAAGINASQMIDEAWASAAENLQNCCTDAFRSMGSGFAEVGAALVKGEDAWGAMGKAALAALASILEGIGGQLAGLAVVHALSMDWVGAALATAGSIAAYVAAGAVKAWANSFATGGIVDQRSGVPTTGDRQQIWVNPGELILNASQQQGLVSTMSALANYGQYRQEQKTVDTQTLGACVYNAIRSAIEDVGLTARIEPSDLVIDGHKLAQVTWNSFEAEADRRGLSFGIV